MKVSKIDEDIKDVARRLIMGNEKRKKRIRNRKESAFDMQAANAIANALSSSCRDITCRTERKQMQEIIYRSIAYSIPYEYIGEVYCGRRKFYEYRNEFILAVAENMEMVSLKGPGNKKEDIGQQAKRRKQK